MGNMSSIGAVPAVVVVTVDNAEMRPGSMLTGTVYLDVKQPTIECSSVDIYIIGQEISAVRYNTYEGTGKEKKKVRRTAHAHSILYNVAFPLATFSEGIIHQGHYQYSYSCLIPDGLPSSMRVNGMSHCRVVYSVYVRLQRHGSMQWTIDHKCIFKVIASSRIPTKGLTMCRYVEPTVVPINSCFCFSRGSLLCGASISSTQLVAGDHARVNFAVRNRSTVHIEYVQVSLMETTSWRAKRYRDHYTRVLFSNIIRDIQTENTEPLASVSSVHDAGQSLREVRDVLTSGKYGLDITVPKNCYDSYRGTLLKVTHLLHVQFKTPGGTNSPILSTEVFIYGSSTLSVNEGREDGDNDTDQQKSLNFQVPTCVPEGWSPVGGTGSPVILPSSYYSTPVELDGENLVPGVGGWQSNFTTVDGPSDLPNPSVSPTAASTTDFQGFMLLLGRSYDQIGEVRDWVNSHCWKMTFCNLILTR